MSPFGHPDGEDVGSNVGVSGESTGPDGSAGAGVGKPISGLVGDPSGVGVLTGNVAGAAGDGSAGVGVGKPMSGLGAPSGVRVLTGNGIVGTAGAAGCLEVGCLYEGDLLPMPIPMPIPPVGYS